MYTYPGFECTVWRMTTYRRKICIPKSISSFRDLQATCRHFTQNTHSGVRESYLVGKVQICQKGSPSIRDINMKVLL